MSKFKPEVSDDGQGTVQKVSIGGWEGPVVLPEPLKRRFQVQKDAAGEKELGLSGQVEHRNGDGDVQELGRRIAQIYRRVAGTDNGSHTLSEPERRGVRDRMLEAMTEQGMQVTPELRAVASLLAGLKDELPLPERGTVQKSAGAFGTVEAQCPHCHQPNSVEVTGAGSHVPMQKITCSHCSKSWSEDIQDTRQLNKIAGLEKSAAASPELRQVMNETREKLEILRKRITELLDQRAAASASSTRFETSAVEKDAVAQQELRKALANGKPAQFDGEGIKKTSFQTIESAAPGVRMPANTLVNALPADGVVKARSKFQPQQ